MEPPTCNPLPAISEARRALASSRDRSAHAQAFDQLEQAAGVGNVEALCLLAVMDAGGAGRPQDRAKALDRLATAAERGSRLAQAQLRVLAGTAGDQNWQSLRCGIDVGRLVQAPEKQDLAEQPRIRMVKQFASAAECRWLITRFGGSLGPAKIWNALSGQGE